MSPRIAIDAVLRLPADATAAGTSFVGEPSLGIHDRQILFTGNWYVARSVDRGATWEGFDPGDYFPHNPPTRFCCDQSVLYVPEHDVFVWLLQYKRSAQNNTLRIAVKRGSTPLDEGEWFTWDLSPTDVDEGWTKEWFDYNHLAATDRHLFIGSNVFGLGGKDVFRSVVIRISFAALSRSIDHDDSLELSFLAESDSGPFRCTLGARGTMYIAGQRDTQSLRIFAWPDEDDHPTVREIAVSEWVDGFGGYSAPGPDGREWMTRTTDRITAAWVAKGHVGFMWSVDRIDDRRPFPYVRAAILDEQTFRVVAEPDIWAREHAYAWPDACPNSDGMVGITIFRGGGSFYPSHAIGVLDDATTTWALSDTIDGTSGPSDKTWGDYLTCRAQSPDGSAWIAAGYTLQGGASVDRVEPFAALFHASDE
jgi:hypothetical protein